MSGMMENEKIDNPDSSEPSIERRVDNSEVPTRKKEGVNPYNDGTDKVILTEDDCYEELGFCFPTWKKWTILSVIFIVQVSMNFNTSLYSNAIGGMTKEFGISSQAARCGAMVFLVLYAFGCELWAPWSEELGRWPVLQLSLFLVNIWQLPVALAPNFGTVMAGRALGGLSSAGGSVTLGMVADMWESDEQQYAVAFVVFSSVGGSVLGPIVGGFVEQYAYWYVFVPIYLQGHPYLLHIQEMEHLDTIDLWLLRSSDARLPGPGDQNKLHAQQDRQTAPQGRRKERIWTYRAHSLERSLLSPRAVLDHDAAIYHVSYRAHCAHAVSPLWFQRRPNLHVFAILCSSVRTMGLLGLSNRSRFPASTRRILYRLVLLLPGNRTQQASKT
jgi:hypothetical protein